MKGHTGKKCKLTNNPKLFPELDNINTQICQQINFWLGKFKYILKHKSVYPFNFFLFIIFDMYNQIKLEGIIDIADCIHFEKCDATKRLIEEVLTSGREPESD